MGLFNNLRVMRSVLSVMSVVVWLEMGFDDGMGSTQGELFLFLKRVRVN